jgi:RimJ/RimL family protein N-acetyltransferase
LLKGQKIFLLPIERHDIITLNEWIKKGLDFSLISPSSLFALNLDELENWYNSLIYNPKIRIFVIRNIEHKTPIGLIELNNIDWKNRNAEIGIFIAYENLRNKGFGSDTLKVIINYAFNELNLFKLYAKIAEDNYPSIKLFEKFNFKKEAVLRKNIFKNNEYIDLLIYGLLKEEFSLNNNKQ